jgi:hypothetical protein
MRGNDASLVFYPLLQFEKPTTARKNNQIFEHIKERKTSLFKCYTLCCHVPNILWNKWLNLAR